MKRLDRTLFVPAALLALAAASCSSTRAGRAEPLEAEATEEASATKSDEAKDAEKKDPEELRWKVADAERELRLAKMDADVSRTKTRHAVAGAEESAEKARVEVEKAEKALALFREIDKPRRVREAELGVQRAEFRIENERQDLQQMVDDYEGVDEPYAKATGEIVVWRSRKQLEFAEAALQLEIQERDKLVAHTLPDQEAQLERELALKRAEHERTVQQLESERIEAEAGMIRAEAKVEKAERDLKKARKELEA